MICTTNILFLSKFNHENLYMLFKAEIVLFCMPSIIDKHMNKMFTFNATKIYIFNSYNSAGEF